MISRRLPSYILAFLTLLICANAYAFNIYRVGNVVKGQEYNDIWKKWFDKDFSIWVGISDDGTKYIVFKAETGLGDATVTTRYSAAARNRLERLISKAIKWSGVAKKNRADTTKVLGCFGDDMFGVCKQNGRTSDPNQVALSFFAANDGQQTNLIIEVEDGQNQFYKARLYFDPPQMQELLDNVHLIDEAFAKAKETAKKQNLFK